MRGKLISTLIVAVFLLSTVASAAPATTTQVAAVESLMDNDGPKGMDKIQGTWQTKNELHTMYLDGTAATYSNSGGCSNFNLYTADGTTPGLAPGSVDSITFSIVTTTNDFNLHRFQSVLHLASGGNTDVRVELLDDTTVIKSAMIDFTTSGGTQVPTFQTQTASEHTVVFHSEASPPLPIPEGAKLKIRLTGVAPTASEGDDYADTTFTYGGTACPGRIDMFGDTARVNIWTEDSFGRVSNAFPIGQNAPAEDREIHMWAVHVNALGDGALTQHGSSISIIDKDGGNRRGASDPAQRIVTLGTTNLPAMPPGIKATELRFLYPDSMTDPAGNIYEGVLNMRISGSGQSWSHEYAAAIGGAAVELNRAQFEDQSKTILVGEETTFLFTLKNNGLSHDDVIITGESVNGWNVEAHVDSVNLAPGESRTFPVTIEPPANGLSGDSQVFEIKAISSRTGRSDSESITVILTSTETKGVDVLSTQLNVVKMQAGQERTAAVTIKNLGNSKNTFTVSTSGQPLGWKATVSPSTTELGAKSQSGAILRVTAPSDAKMGDAFGLVVTARSQADNSVKDTLVIPYEIFYKETFTFDVLSGAADGKFTATASTLADVQVAVSNAASPGIHVLRDEGIDGAAPHWDGTGDPDGDYDQSTLFRVQLSNQGGRSDTITVAPEEWVTDAAWVTRDVAGCEIGANRADGIPDGWRIRTWEDGAPEPNQLAGYGNNPHDSSPNTLSQMAESYTLAPGETKFIWVEMGWREVQRGVTAACPASSDQAGSGARSADPSKDVVVRFNAQSQRDPTKSQDLYLRTHIEGAGTRQGHHFYSGQHNDLLLAVDNSALTNPDNVGTEAKFLTVGSSTQRTATYHIRGINAGNEMDIIRFELPPADGQFSYKFDRASVDKSQMRTNWVDGSSASRQTATCSITNDDMIMDCTMGAWDEVQFEVDVTAKVDSNGQALVPIGLQKKVPLRAMSLDSQRSPAGTLIKYLDLTAVASGTHSFSLTHPVVPNNGIHDIKVTPGGSLRVPFTIENTGTSFDSYAVSLLEQPAASAGWDAVFGFNSPQYVAASKEHHGFLTIYAPTNAAPGTSETFRFKVSSIDGTGVPDRTLRIQANIVAASSGIELVANPVEVLGVPGNTVPVKYTATRTAAGASNVEFVLDTAGLAPGWSVTPASAFRQTVAYDALGKAEATFNINIPSDATGASRVVTTVTATDSAAKSATAQGVISLDSATLGVKLFSPDDFEAEEIRANVVSGSKVDIEVRVQNLGGDVDQILLTPSTLPSGWRATFSEGNPSAATFQPFEARTIIMTVTAPEGTQPGNGIDIILKAESVSDSSKSDTIIVAVRTGQSVLDVFTPVDPVRFVAPLEQTTYSFVVLNNGTVRDQIKFQPGLSAAYRDVVPVTFTPQTATLAVGESIQVTAVVEVPEGFLSGAVIPLRLQAVSDGSQLNAMGETTVEVRVASHRVKDVDEDGNPEYAIDRDRDASNGFEEYRDPKTTGKRSVSMNMAGLLSASAVQNYTFTVTDSQGVESTRFIWNFDLTGDGRIDHFIDDNNDNLADYFWNPSTNARTVLTTTYDVTGDGVREYFVDVNSDQVLDVWYDIRTGKVGQLFKTDVDGDGVIDFVVDLNFNGINDANEPVLFGKDGRITRITQSIDVNGDGLLDLVVDEDGDGINDYFVPNGKTRGVQIVMEDVTGDGVEDWTYDANNDGKRDSYYDPVTGETGSIDKGTLFIDGLVQYWYVPALFGFVTLLFVVLVVVTRR